MGANNSELFSQQVQIMIFVQLKQVFLYERIEYVGTNVMDRTEDHHRETAILCFAKKGFELPYIASQLFNSRQYLGK